MTTNKIEIERTWGEVGFGSSKRDGYMYEIRFFRFDGREYNRVDTIYVMELRPEYLKEVCKEFIENDRTPSEIRIGHR